MGEEEEEEEEEDEDGGLAMESMPWMASRVLGEAGASSLRERRGDQPSNSNRKVHKRLLKPLQLCFFNRAAALSTPKCCDDSKHIQ